MNADCIHNYMMKLMGREMENEVLKIEEIACQFDVTYGEAKIWIESNSYPNYRARLAEAILLKMLEQDSTKSDAVAVVRRALLISDEFISSIEKKEWIIPIENVTSKKRAELSNGK